MIEKLWSLASFVVHIRLSVSVLHWHQHNLLLIFFELFQQHNMNWGASSEKEHKQINFKRFFLRMNSFNFAKLVAKKSLRFLQIAQCSYKKLIFLTLSFKKKKAQFFPDKLKCLKGKVNSGMTFQKENLVEHVFLIYSVILTFKTVSTFFPLDSFLFLWRYTTKHSVCAYWFYEHSITAIELSFDFICLFIFQLPLRHSHTSFFSFLI